MTRVKTFVADAWAYSGGRIHRADPLLMGAAIAYNSLFALVPLAVAFVAMLSFFDRSGNVLTDLIVKIEDALPPDLAEFLVDVLQQSSGWLDGDRTLILVLSLLIALWSGSRAVYAVQKALRTVEGLEDERGYVKSRLLGIGVTVGAGIAVLLVYAAALIGGQLLSAIEDEIGFATASAARLVFIAAAIVWVWLLLWAIYRWGPPEPMAYSGIVSASVAALLVLGSIIASSIIPGGNAATSVFGAIGIFLVWLYYVGVVIVAAPTIFAGLALAFRKQRQR